jgi:hypothetical protein
MSWINKQLLCRFSDSMSYNKHVDDIQEKCDLIDGRVFIFESEKDPRKVYITFNIEKIPNIRIQYPNTISIHRKKYTNTLYTLNAMNRLIEDENDGVFDKTHQLDWDLYKNSLVLTNDPGVKIIPLKLAYTLVF